MKQKLGSLQRFALQELLSCRFSLVSLMFSISTCNQTSQFSMFCFDWLLHPMWCVYKSLESFSNFHSFIVHLLFQELYFILSFSVVDIKTHTHHWKCWLLLYLLGEYFVGQSVDDLFGSVIQRGDDPFSVKVTWNVFWQGTGCKLVFGREFQQEVDCDLWWSVVSRTDGKMVWINICQLHRWYSHAVSIAWSPIPLKQKLIIPSLQAIAANQLKDQTVT